MRNHVFVRGVKLLGAIAAVLGAAALPQTAQACGGLFCSSSSPVNQAAERIVFAKNGDGTVTAAIEILYEGPSRKFAWLLPVPPADVTVGVSSKQALDALQQASNPSYGFQTTFQECPTAVAGPISAPVVASANPSAAAVLDSAGFAPVEVVASGNVGPYDYAQIAVNPADEDPAQAAIDWLEAEGYDVGALGPDVLRPYLMQDMNLLAFRLSKGNDSGSIRPVMLTYPGERPLIPIRPTAVAANEDMGILVWVLGNGRAVPTSYLHLELNEVMLDWFNPGPVYNDLVTRAADEAGGNGFVTEHSGPAGAFIETIYPTSQEQQFATLRTGRFDSVQQFFEAAVQTATSFTGFSTGFAGPFAGQSAGPNVYDGFLDILSDPTLVPLREGATPEQFLSCVSCYFQQGVAVQNGAYPSTPFDPETDPILEMDVQKFLDEMEALVIDPLRQTRALFEQNSQVTRLYTTLSPDEMLVDPEFDLNPELPDVSNIHTADRVMACDGTSWTITLPQGVRLKGEGNTWPVSLDDEEMPLNVRIVQLNTAGEGEVLLDNTDKVVSRLVNLGIGTDAASPETSSDEQSSGGGCSLGAATPGTPVSPAAWAVGILALFGLRRARLRPLPEPPSRFERPTR